MASLIIPSNNGQVAAGNFRGRVLIGRKPFNGVQFELRSISRIHAWIDVEGKQFYVADAASRAGTTVNGQRAAGKVFLHDGDVIGIGSERLVFRTTDKLPDGAISFGISDKGTNPDYSDHGILIRCKCGAPLWVPSGMAGAYGRCVHCKGEIDVPGEAPNGVRRPLTPNDSIADMPAITEELGSAARPDDPLAADFPRPQPKADVHSHVCGICQKPMNPSQATLSCPACSQPYHEKCWEDNGGCAAYGCIQAGMMMPLPPAAPTQPAPALARATEAPAAPLPSPMPKRKTAVVSVLKQAQMPQVARAPQSPQLRQTSRRSAEHLVIPWDKAVLMGSVIGVILGTFTFGVPALAMAAAALASSIRWRRENLHSSRIAAVATAICVIGIAIGVFTSILFWFNGPAANR
jgi:pSer/pThr/pTyr-binding forkhead associated (FHA) protein